VKPRKTLLTDQELEIMKVIWDRDTATVRDVYESLRSHRKIAYTTVLTMMGILEQKGHLKKSTSDRAYVYRPSEPKGKVVGRMVEDFVKRVFDGSAKPLLVHLVENDDLDDRQLAEIRRLLREREKNQ